MVAKYEHDGFEVTGVESSHYTLAEACDALRSHFPSQYGDIDYEIGLSDDEEVLEKDDPRYFEPSEDLYAEADLEGSMRLYIEKKPAPRLTRELQEFAQASSQGTPAPAGAATHTSDCAYLLERMVTPSRGDSYPYPTMLRDPAAYSTLLAANTAARQL